jgi:hypothetical protein
VRARDVVSLAGDVVTLGVYRAVLLAVALSEAVRGWAHPWPRDRYAGPRFP